MADANILIVDDEEAIREMISVSLELAGFQWMEAENGQLAHSMIVDERPDLILLDWMLPGVSGIEFAREIRADANLRDLPIIMLTARAEEEDRVRGLTTAASLLMVAGVGVIVAVEAWIVALSVTLLTLFTLHVLGGVGPRKK